jgi:hypothetical protein
MRSADDPARYRSMGHCPHCGVMLASALDLSDGGLLSVAKALLRRRDNVDPRLWDALEAEVVWAERVRDRA